MQLPTKVQTDKVLIIGATSIIAEAVAKHFVFHQYDIYLLARDQAKLSKLKTTLCYHGANFVYTASFHAENLSDIAKQLDKIFQKTKINIVLLAYGVLPEQKLAQKNWSILAETMHTNGISILFILEYLARKMEQVKEGTIAVMTSLAVENSNQDNYIYAASKAMVASFLKGFSIRLSKSGVKVIDLRPALVQSPMTKRIYKKLTITPKYVAEIIFEKIIKANQSIVYIPPYYKLIMFFVRNIPSNFLASVFDLFSSWNKKK